MKRGKNPVDTVGAPRRIPTVPPALELELASEAFIAKYSRKATKKPAKA